MAAGASFFLVVSIWLAVLLGPKLSCWTWGPSLMALGVAVVVAVPEYWRQRTRAAGGWQMVLMGIGVLVVAWFGWRAWVSPVAQQGMADLLLLAGVVGGFVVMRAMQERVLAERVFLWGLALLVLASVVLVARQVMDPEMAPVLVARLGTLPTGFFGHYNYGANFLIGASCLVGGAAVGGHHSKLERWLWGLIAVAGMVAVYFTRSRGGICGAAAGLGAFAVMALIVGKRQGARWFAPAIVAVPLIGFVVVGFLFRGWSDAQEVRRQAPGIESLMDNTVRLYLTGIAGSCIGLHPWAGGGSRSFSWECYRFWDTKMYGPGTNRPEQVHNEILQAAADYGITGAGLLVLFIGTIGVGAVVRALFVESKNKFSSADGWWLGGLAGLVGILVQSNFSFVFHQMPGALLLGLCLGRVAHAGDGGKILVGKPLVSPLVVSAVALACAALLVPMGWTGSRVTATRWADAYGKPAEISPEARIEALTEAIRLWPLQEFLLARARLYHQQLMKSPQGPGAEAAVNLALEDYREAAALNPFDPEPVVNRANLLGMLGKDAAALQQFERAIHLQGGMEAGFKGGFSKAAYLKLKAERLLANKQNGEALEVMLGARAALVKACEFPSGAPLGQDARELRIVNAQRLGVLLSLAGRDREAEEEFESAAIVWGGSGTNYLYAWHLRNKAERIWKERRPAEALGLFLKARGLLDRAGSPLPAGVTSEDHTKLRQDLDKFIQFLKGAKVEPSGVPGTH
ncbi:MAG: O-antigen ligase family protein [Verrucomicrobiota bacterium]